MLLPLSEQRFFHFQILQTFEKLELSEQVIQIANYAIEKIATDDPNLVSTWFVYWHAITVTIHIYKNFIGVVQKT